jgi:glycosyltransferase involved in cell wall biosynthesis
MESVFAQNYRPIEIVVLDDGSTDNTPELMKTYDEKVRYYWQENRGVAIARTAACRLAKGEFIAFQDDDDLMPPDRIILLYEALRRNPSAVFAIGDWAVIDGNGNLTGQRSRTSINFDNDEPILIQDGYEAVLWPRVTATPHTTLFRRADGERIGWFDSLFFHACEDTDFFARCGLEGSVVYVPKVVSLYRKAEGTLSANRALLSYSRILLFTKHLMSIKSEKREQLRKRLQLRMFQMYKQLAIYQSQGLKFPDSVSIEELSKGLSLMEPKYRLAYLWLTKVKLPLRSLILRSI